MAQVVGLYGLLSHQSDTGNFLGRYSSRYGLVIGAALLWLMVSVILFLRRRTVNHRLETIPDRVRRAVIVLSGGGVFVLWFLPVEDTVKQYFSINWITITALLLRTTPNCPGRFRYWKHVIVAVWVVLLPVMFITALSVRSFSPDEAHWADYARSAFVPPAGIYARTWLQAPVTISPGVGWSVAVYGWVLEHLHFDITTGRIWNFTSYLLAFVGIAAVTWRLYGSKAALVSTTFAILSRAFIPVWDYRPDHQLVAAAMFITFTALQSRYARVHSGPWHFACGLLAALSLELHAAGIVLAFGFALLYVGEFIFRSYRHRRLASLRPLITFGVGAFIGTTVYYLLNIQPVGGLQAYLTFLASTRFAADRSIHFLNWPALVEGLVIVAGLAYLFRRNTTSDHLFLAIVVCVLAGVVLLDPIGYRSLYSGFYIVPVGVLLIEGLSVNQTTDSPGNRSLWLTSCILLVLVGQVAGSFIDWFHVRQWLTSGNLPPFLYTELRPALMPRLRSDDTIVSTHQLVWTVPDQTNLVSFAAEATGMERWNLTRPIEVWERVQPTVILYVDRQMHLNPGLEAYSTQYGFQVCERFQVLDTDIELYRRDCSKGN